MDNTTPPLSFFVNFFLACLLVFLSACFNVFMYVCSIVGTIKRLCGYICAHIHINVCTCTLRGQSLILVLAWEFSTLFLRQGLRKYDTLTGLDWPGWTWIPRVVPSAKIPSTCCYIWFSHVCSAPSLCLCSKHSTAKVIFPTPGSSFSFACFFKVGLAVASEF